MSLRAMAEADLGAIIEDPKGFAWPVTVTSPAGDSALLAGFSDDIADVIDPETGLAISGRRASVALRISSIYAEGLELPRAIADASGLPWVVEFDDINGAAHRFKVCQSNPDRALGLLTCTLEAYR